MATLRPLWQTYTHYGVLAVHRVVVAKNFVAGDHQKLHQRLPLADCETPPYEVVRVTGDRLF